MSINEIQDEIIAEFSDFDDWMDRYQLLIDMGSEQEPLEEQYKTEQNLIDGCQSRVWLQADFVDGQLSFFYCGTRFVYHLAEQSKGLDIPAETAEHIFARDGQVKQIDVYIKL